MFLDRDGVLNVDHGYVATPDRFEWTPDAPEAVRWLNENGWLAIVATNQSGIARGLFSEADFQRLMAWVQTELGRSGAHLDAWYVCPHHPTEGTPPYKADCDCRKPKPGLVRRALSEWNLDAAKCALIGDGDRDLEAARGAGVAGFRYNGGSLLSAVQAAAAAVEPRSADSTAE